MATAGCAKGVHIWVVTVNGCVLIIKNPLNVTINYPICSVHAVAVGNNVVITNNCLEVFNVNINDISSPLGTTAIDIATGINQGCIDYLFGINPPWESCCDSKFLLMGG